MATKAKRTANPGPKQSKYKKKRSPTPWLIGGGIALLILVPASINIYRWSQLPGERFPSLGNLHIGQGDEVTYNSTPPTSGPHYPSIAGWGTYTELNDSVSDPYLVHNMEDAGVVLWYRAGTPEENQQRASALESAYDSARYRRVIIVPRENLETLYAMTAWQRLETFDEVNPEQINTFMEAYEGIDHHPAGGEG